MAASGEGPPIRRPLGAVLTPTTFPPRRPYQTRSTASSALFGVITASIASYFVTVEQEDSVDPRVEEITRSLRRIEEHLGIRETSAVDSNGVGAPEAVIAFGPDRTEGAPDGA
ncbi:MAG TPA: hypothetical protein VKV36_07110 [Acidimicrobiales bacterium]|nr:hypothetical protein [Acidimicrobiales bacterium]